MLYQRVHTSRFASAGWLAAVFVLLATWSIVSTPLARAASTWYIAPSGNDGNDCLAPGTACKTIAAAIGKAIAGDTINIAGGTYVENVFDIKIDKNLRMVGAGAAMTIIDGKSVEISAGVSANISGATIQNGGCEGIGNQGTLTLNDSIIRDNGACGADGTDGGGIYNTGTMTINNSTISDNFSGGSLSIGTGGGIYNADTGQLILNNSVVTRNHASGPFSASGGGINNLGALTITNSTISGNTVTTEQNSGAGSCGGGICNAGTLTIINSVVSGNAATVGMGSIGSSAGGGIDNGGTLNIVGSLITDNSVGHFGGGINNIGTLKISNSTIRRNSATVINGGGISNGNGGVVTLTRVAITNNSAAADGGGIGNSQSVFTLTDSTISNNRAGADGGGMVSDGTLNVMNSTISGNVTGRSGGGILNITDGRLDMANSSVSGNSAGDRGGGIANLGNAVTNLNNTTIVQNSAQNSGGGLIAATGILKVRNTILAANLDPADSPDCAGPLTSQGYNLIGNNTGCGFTSAIGDKVGTSSNPIDPQLGLLQNNGGNTLTHMPLPDSPAIDGGNPATPGSGGTACLATDQRGQARPYKAACDIGAVERVYRQFMGLIQR